LAARFLDAAMSALIEKQVLPGSPYRPWIHVGVDYPGPLVLQSEQADALEAAIEAALPDRFRQIGPRNDTHRGRDYVLGLLESTVAALTVAQEPYAASAHTARERIRLLVEELTSEHAECHGSVVAYVAGIGLMTRSLLIDGLLATRIDTMWDDVLGEIPGISDEVEELLWPSGGLPWKAGRLVLRADWDPTVGHTAFEIAAANKEIDDLISAARLLTNATVIKQGTVIGQRKPIPVHPAWRQVEPTHDHLIVWRRFDLSAETLQPLVRMRHWLSVVLNQDEPRSQVMTVATGRFHAALDRRWWDEQLLELTIGLEAALLGGDQEGEITHRLRTRAAALLSSAEEPPERVFDEIGALYEMRSSIVHGSPISDRHARRLLEAMQSSQASEMAGERFAVIVDRARDILRRAIITRLCLSEGAAPVWPWKTSRGFSVDRSLTNPDTAREWRSYVQDRLGALGFPEAGRPARRVQGLLGQRDPNIDP